MSAPAERLQSPRWPRPGELWSLWEMLSPYAATFVKIVQILQSMERVGEVSAEGRGPLLQFVRDLLPGVRFYSETFKWRLVTAQVERLHAKLSSEPADGDEVVRGVIALRERIEDELNDCMMWFVEADLAPYHEARQMIGEEVAEKFPDLMEDFESAGDCLCLSQATACVFHLMRAMERAVAALCLSRGIPNPDREWGKLLSDLGKAIEDMPKGPERTAWSEAHANLYHVKEAWRTGTMHPKQTYTVGQAREVFDATKVFLRQLAGLV